jgi:hypothetical protein
VFYDINGQIYEFYNTLVFNGINGQIYVFYNTLVFNGINGHSLMVKLGK